MTYMLNELISFDISNNQIKVIKRTEQATVIAFEPNSPAKNVFCVVIICVVVVVVIVVDVVVVLVVLFDTFTTFISGTKGAISKSSSPEVSPDISKSIILFHKSHIFNLPSSSVGRKLLIALNLLPKRFLYFSLSADSCIFPANTTDTNSITSFVISLVTWLLVC